MSATRRFACMLVGFALLLPACSEQDPKRISLQNPAKTTPPNAREEPRIRIAVGGIVTPRKGMADYRELLRYVGQKIGTPVEYVDREEYAEINEMLRDGRLEAAFVCSGPYVEGHDSFGLELLAAPQVDGKTVYHSYIIVPEQSPARSLSDLRGKRFAFTDPLSNSGKLVPTYMLSKMGETPESFFRQVVFTKAHDRSIQAVADELVDGAAVDSLIWEHLNSIGTESTRLTRIVEKSPPYGIPPLVVPHHLPADLKTRLREVILNLHRDPQGKEILQKMRVERFVPIDDAAYDSVREMQKWLAERRPGD